MARVDGIGQAVVAANDAAPPAEIVRLDAALLAVAHFYASREVHAAIEQSGVTTDILHHFRALRAVRDLPEPVSIKDVQIEIGLSHPATCRTIERCVADGLIERRECEQDRRHIRLALTEAGMAASHSVELARQQVVADMIDGWSTADQRALLDWLERLPPKLTQFRARNSRRAAAEIPRNQDAV